MLGQNAWLDIIGSSRTASHSRGTTFSLRSILTCTNLRTKIVDKLGLSYSSVQELNNVIDTELPGQPRFQCNLLDIGDEKLEFYLRDILECI